MACFTLTKQDRILLAQAIELGLEQLEKSNIEKHKLNVIADVVAELSESMADATEITIMPIRIDEGDLLEDDDRQNMNGSIGDELDRMHAERIA